MLCLSTVSNEKSRKFSGEIDPQLTIHWFIEGECAKNLEATLLFIDFYKAFDSIHRKERADTTSTWSLQGNCYSYNDAL